MNEPDSDLPDASTDAAGSRSRFWLGFLLVGVALAICVILVERRGEQGGSRSPGYHSAVGARLPVLRLEPLTGDSQSVTLKDLAGKVAVINFWGTWCPPCREEFPEIAAFWVQVRSRPDVRLLSVSCEGDDTDLGPLRDKTQEFLDQKQSQLPTYADPSAETRRGLEMVLAEPGFAYPTTVVLDQAGVIRAVWIGYDPGIGDQLKQLVDQLLAK